MAQNAPGAAALSLQASVAAIAHLDLGEIESMGDLATGPVSRSWLLATSRGRMVLRADLPLAAILQLDRKAESEILRACFSAGLGPEWLWSDPSRGLLLTRWLPGKTWSAEQLRLPDNLRRLGSLLEQLHTLPVPPTASGLQPVIENYAAILDDRKSRSIQASASSLCRELDADAGDLVLCHGDIHSGNILDDGALHLVDWEYAACRDRCLDIAIVAEQHELSDSLLTILLDAYADNARPINRPRLEKYRQLYAHVALLWYMVVSHVDPEQAANLCLPPRLKENF